MYDAVALRLRAMLDRATTPNRAGAAAVAVRAGEREWTTVLARSDHRGTVPPPDARFLLYSITKTVVAAAALRLAAAGRLDLDATLDGWLPELPVAARLTPRRLLQHTSGLPDYGGLREYHAAVRAGAPPWSEAEFLARTGADRLLFEPGRGWAYSNIGYMLLRRVLARAGGDDFAAALSREVFGPLGLTSSGVPTRPEELAPLTFGPSRYLGGDGPPATVAGRYHPGWITTGVVAATALDAARFLHGLLAGDLLPAGLRDELRAAVRVGGGPIPGRPWVEPGYGLGLMVELDPAAGPFYGHTGGGPGCTPAVYHFPRASAGGDPVTITVITDGEDIGQAENMVLAASRCFGSRR